MVFKLQKLPKSSLGIQLAKSKMLQAVRDAILTGLVFYSISILVGYLIPDPVYTHTHTHLYMIFKQIVCR